MDETPAVPIKTSVVIVSYNAAAALRRCLSALEQSQGRETIEIFVVDSGSQDESPTLDQEFAGTTFLRLPRNFGLTKARNIASRSANGEYVLFLQPDIEVSPDTIRRLIEALEADSDAWAACPLLVTPDGTPAPLVYKLPERDSLMRAWRQGDRGEPARVDLAAPVVAVDCPSGAALAIRKHYLKGMNYLDERYGEFWSDAEACFQIRRASKKILLVTAARALRHDDLWAPRDSAALAQLSADCALGAAAWVGKRDGFLAGTLFRLRLILSALGQALVGLNRIPHHFARVKFLISGQRIDGSQTSL